jgi:hypothetical protein
MVIIILLRFTSDALRMVGGGNAVVGARDAKPQNLPDCISERQLHLNSHFALSRYYFI